MFRLTILLIALCASAAAQADLKFYGEARAGAGGVRFTDVDFVPRFGSFSVGAFVREGIGIEAFVDIPLADGDSGVFDLGINGGAGAAIRFQSPPTRGLHAYVLLGYAGFQIEQTENGVQGMRRIRETFAGPRVSIGVNQRLNVVDGLIFGAEYRNSFTDSGIVVDGFSLGLRYELR